MALKPPWTQEQSAEALQRLSFPGTTIAQVARTMGVSRWFLQQKVSEARLGTLDADAVLSERMKAGPHPLPAGHPLAKPPELDCQGLAQPLACAPNNPGPRPED